MITAKEIFDQQSKADKSKLMDYLRNNPSSRRIFKVDFTQPFFEDLADRRDNKIESHVILTGWGFTGSFKSSLFIELNRFMDKHFSAQKIAFTNQELLDVVEMQKSKGSVMRDEVTAEFGIGSGRQQAFLQVQAETLRKLQISFSYLSPELKPIGTEHYFLHTIGHNKFSTNGGTTPTEPVYVLFGVVNPSTRNYLGGAIVEIEWNNPVWVQYSKKKDIFLKNVRERQFAKQDMTQMAEKCYQDPLSKYAKTKNDWLIVIQRVHPTITTQEMDMVYAMIKMTHRMQDAEADGEEGDED